jgi:hypothetical protein
MQFHLIWRTYGESHDHNIEEISLSQRWVNRQGLANQKMIFQHDTVQFLISLNDYHHISLFYAKLFLIHAQ